MSSEPIFWISTNAAENQRARERVIFVDGERRVERIPQRGHVGDFENRRPARGQRSIKVVRTEGHVLDMLLTCAAAHLDPTTSFGQYQRAKARFHGWYPIASCPCALVATGEMRTNHFVDQKVAKDKPCDPGSYSEKAPCKHALAEQVARRLSHTAKEAKRMAGFKGSTEKLVESNNAQTAAIVNALTDALGGKAIK